MNTRAVRIAVPAVVAAYLLALLYAWLIYAPSDDTYIYLVYAKNYLQGNGLTFNGMKVQGFTSVLWMWLIVLVGKLGVMLPKAADILSAASGLFVVSMTCYTARLIGLSWRGTLAVLALLVCSGDFTFYMGNGLETVFFAGALLWSASYVFRADAGRALASWTLPFALALTMLARPEGVMVAGLVLGILTWESRRWAMLLRNVAVVVVLVVPVLIWQQMYYGSWIPNTYYAKAGAGISNLPQGLRYIRNFVAANALVMLLLLCPLVMRSRKLDRTERWMYTGLGLWILHVSIQGGDNMVGFRALLPIVPVQFVLLVYQFRELDMKRFVFGVAALCLVQLLIYNGGYAVGSSWGYDVKFHADQWRKILPERRDIAGFLREALPEDGVIAVNAAGTVPYYSGLRTIDMLGLNNAHIARYGRRDRSLPYGHQCGDGDYVIRQQPDAIMFSGMGTIHGEVFVGDREVEATREFRAFYRLRKLPHGHHVYLRNTGARHPDVPVDSRTVEENKR